MFISYEHCNSPARHGLSYDDRAGGIPTYRERSSIMRNLFLSALVLAFMCVAVPVQAGLTLNVDATTGEVFFTGTDFGTPDSNSRLSFQSTPGNLFNAGTPFLNPSLINGVNEPVQLFTAGNTFDGPIEEVIVNLTLPNNLFTLLTGSGERVNSTLGDLSLAALTSFNGQSIPRVSSGTGFEELHIVDVNAPAAVPEPGSLTVLALAGLSLVARRRRRC